MQETKSYISEILKSLPDISTIAEIQCGSEFDIENCQALKNKNLQYFGLDLRDEIISENRQFFRLEKNKIFITLDASNEPIPKADLIISLDFSKILPIANIWSLLENIRDSEAKYFLFDYDLEEKNLNEEISENSDIKSRPINLSKFPFYFPLPTFLIKNENKLIACYKISDFSYFMDFYSPEVTKLRKELFEFLKQDFDFLKKTFFNHFKENNSFEEMMLEFLKISGEEHNKKYYHQEKFKNILDKEKNLDIRNHIFRLVYKCEIELLQKKYNFVDEDNFSWAQILSKDFIRFYFNQSLFID
jgi:hypothetical protein